MESGVSWWSVVCHWWDGGMWCVLGGMVVCGVPSSSFFLCVGGGWWAFLPFLSFSMLAGLG